MDSREGRRCWGLFVRDEEAQATVEYILMLAVAVVLALLTIRRLIRPLYERMQDFINGRIDQFFRGDFHHLPIGR